MPAQHGRPGRDSLAQRRGRELRQPLVGTDLCLEAEPLAGTVGRGDDVPHVAEPELALTCGARSSRPVPRATSSATRRIGTGCPEQTL